ncbi:hypothetical protein ACM6RL_29185 [Bacillus thuringiensis]|uniref:hypothetical protein n=1 Tax=Bacillus thuringiensis TaxID=1428 RepID=UPI0039FD7253
MEIDWTIIFSIAGAFGAASTAQYFSHRLTLKREDEKYKKEKYQKFYSPLVFKIVKYIEAEGSKISGVNRSTNPDPNQIFTSIITTIEKNIQYADSDFIKIYEEAKTAEMVDYLEDDDFNFLMKFLASMQFDSHLNAFEQFFTDYLKISKDLNVLSSKVEKEVKESIVKIKLYNLFSEHGLLTTAKILFAVGEDSVNENNIDSFIKEIDDVNEITNNNYKPYKQTGDAIHNDCYDDLFFFLEKIVKNTGVNFPECSIKDGLSDDIPMLRYKTKGRIAISRIEDFNL